MKIDHCPICDSYEFTPISHDDFLNVTIYRCDDCGYEFEIEDFYFGYDTEHGWENSDN